MTKRLQMIIDALKAADRAARAIEDKRDDGSCNMDSPFLYGIRLTDRERAQVMLESGIDLNKVNWAGSTGYFVRTFHPGQADYRTRCVIAAANALTAAGLKCRVYYQLD